MEKRRWSYFLQQNYEPPKLSKVLCFNDANADKTTIRNAKLDQFEIHLKSAISIREMSVFQVHDI